MGGRLGLAAGACLAACAAGVAHAQPEAPQRYRDIAAYDRMIQRASLDPPTAPVYCEGALERNDLVSSEIEERADELLRDENLRAAADALLAGQSIDDVNACRAAPPAGLAAIGAQVRRLAMAYGRWAQRFGGFSLGFGLNQPPEPDSARLAYAVGKVGEVRALQADLQAVVWPSAKQIQAALTRAVGDPNTTANCHARVYWATTLSIVAGQAGMEQGMCGLMSVWKTQ